MKKETGLTGIHIIAVLWLMYLLTQTENPLFFLLYLALINIGILIVVFLVAYLLDIYEKNKRSITLEESYNKIHKKWKRKQRIRKFFGLKYEE